MKKLKTVIIPSILIISLISLNCYAQIPDCSGNYEAGLKLYNSGLADSALTILNPCMSNKNAMNNLSKETAANIFRLASLSAIMTGDPVSAEEYVKKMLKYKPDYKNNFREDDLMEFRILVNKAFSQPAHRIGLTGGTNIPFVELQKKYSNYETSPSTEYILDGSYGFQFGIAGEKFLTRSISIGVEAGITRILFTYTVKSSLYQQYRYDQSLNYIEIPVLARYYFFAKSSFKPFLQAGVSGKISLNKMEKSDKYGKYWLTQSYNSDKILTTFLTDYEHFALLLGGGVEYDLKNVNIRLDFRYNHSFKNSVSSSKFNTISGYDDFTNHEKFYYTDDINLISLKNIQISIGLLYNLSYKVF
jgi:hypothetical protein